MSVPPRRRTAAAGRTAAPARAATPARAAQPRRPRAASKPSDALVGSEIELEVGAVGTGGICIARLDGRVVFVRHALPGERVRALVTEGTVGRPLRADALEVLADASPDRAPAPCPHAGPGKCGGCDWQHVTPEGQRRLKTAVVREQMSRLAGLDVDVEVEAVPDVPGSIGPGFGWRTRVQFAVDAQEHLGLRLSRSHEVHRVESCPLAHPKADTLGAGTREWPGLAAVELIVSPADAAVIVTPVPGTPPDAKLDVPDLDAPSSLLRATPPTPRGMSKVSGVRGRPGVREQALGRNWRVSGSGFWQVHPEAARTLTARVLDILQPVKGDLAVDLYAGVGLFAGALGERVGMTGRVVAVEGDADAAEDARNNLADLPSVTVRTGRVEDVILTSGLRQADIVVLDPPRSGAGLAVMESICSLGARAIAYVACDPSSLARDTALAAERGYRLKKLWAYDLFPNTQHVECVAHFEPAT